MLRIVRPIRRTRTIVSAPTIAAIEAVTADEIIVLHYRPPIPVRMPTPAAPTESAKELSDGDAETESKASPRIVQRRIVVTIGGNAPNVLGIVVGNVDRLRVSRLNFNGALRALVLVNHILLRRRGEPARVPRLTAEDLDGVHDIALLRQKSVAEIGRPLYIRTEPVEGIRKHDKSLNACIPRLLASRRNQILAAQITVRLPPLRGLLQFHWIGGSDQHLTQQ